MMYSVILQSVPPVLQKRIVQKMIKECDLGVSKEEFQELEKMYTPREKYYLNGPIINIMRILLEIITTGSDQKKAFKIVSDFIASLEQNQFKITTRNKDQVAEIKHYTEKLQE